MVQCNAVQCREQWPALVFARVVVGALPVGSTVTHFRALSRSLVRAKGAAICVPQFSALEGCCHLYSAGRTALSAAICVPLSVPLSVLPFVFRWAHSLHRCGFRYDIIAFEYSIAIEFYKKNNWNYKKNESNELTVQGSVIRRGERKKKLSKRVWVSGVVTNRQREWQSRDHYRLWSLARRQWHKPDRPGRARTGLDPLGLG